jgi:putative redox protein
VSLLHTRDYVTDAENSSETPTQVEKLVRNIQLIGDLTEAEKTRLLEIADRCPVHRTLHNNPQVETYLVGTD